jgi:tRNA pseudouridine55 synthase
MTEPINGVIVIDKPVGPTSFAIVRQARRLTGARKVGHGGTLDPLASGVLPICFGEATKLAQFLLGADKEYQATISFGVETDTYDATGTITARRPAGQLSAEEVTRALAGFVGEQAQIPPMYSALKRSGRPLYSYARAGQTVDRAPRTVTIHALDLRAFAPATDGVAPLSATATASASATATAIPGEAPEARITVRCSKGTYVRTLAHDLGRAVGTGAHLAALRRTRSGPFGLEHAVAPEALSLRPLPVVSLTDALSHLPRVEVSPDAALALARGKRISWAQATPLGDGGDGSVDLIRVLAPSGDLLAVARRGETGQELIQTVRVFHAACY